MRAAPVSARTAKPELVSLSLEPALDLTEGRIGQPLQLEITVRYSCGAFNTNQVFGFRSSSTIGERQAAEQQALKVFGTCDPSRVALPRLPGGHPTEHVFRASGRLPVAWCWADGTVEIGETVPEDAIAIATGPHKNLAAEMDVACRHGKGRSQGLLLVPGIPEAANQQEGLRALRAFITFFGSAEKKLRRLGITYATYSGAA